MQAMLVQSAFILAYFLISRTGAALVKRLSYKRSAAIQRRESWRAGCAQVNSHLLGRRTDWPIHSAAIAEMSGSLGFALILPALCYGIIAAFGFYAREGKVD